MALAGVSNLGWLSEAELRGGDRPRHGNHLYGSFASDFATADGQRVMVVALTEGQWKGLKQATGTAKVFEALEAALGTDLHQEEARYRHRETIAAILRPWFAGRDLDRLIAAFNPLEGRAIVVPTRRRAGRGRRARRPRTARHVDHRPLAAALERRLR